MANQTDFTVLPIKVLTIAINKMNQKYELI